MSELTFTSKITVKYLQHMGNDFALAAAAKVLEPEAYQKYLQECETAGQDRSVAGLLNYLMEHRHGTPFEHSALSVYVHAPIFVWREWHRHRIGQCLSGRSVLDFVIPSATDRRSRTIEDLYRSWHHGPLNKRSSVRAMRLRCLDFQTNDLVSTGIVNVYSTGRKPVYKVLVGNKCRVIECSADHRFYTPDGWKSVSEFTSNQSVVAIRRIRKNTAKSVKPSGPEIWKEYPYHDGYEVSTHGRIRSYMIQGCQISTRRRSTAVMKNITYKGRAVVNINGRVLQVSRMVMETFFNLKSEEWALHRDDNPFNNCVDNLYIGTDEDNKRDLKLTGGVGLGGVEEKVINIVRVGMEQTYDVEVEHPDHNFIADGVVVHNSYNEQSARYTQLEPVFYIPPKDRPMMKVEGWKAGRPKFTLCEDPVAYTCLCTNLKHSYSVGYEMYERNLALDIDPGLARDCLPVGIYSSCWVTCNPRSLMAFLSLRTYEPDSKFVSYPLYEIEVAARQLEKIFEQYWPLTCKAFTENGRVGP